MPAEITLFEAIYTQRAIRKYRREPVPDALIEKVLEAATKAPSVLNLQPWRFVVVREPATVRWIAELYRDTWLENRKGPSVTKNAGGADDKVWTHAADFATQGIFDVPCFIVVCTTRPQEAESVLQCCQNLMLAARGLGLGTVFTTLLARKWNVLKEKLGIPKEVAIMAMIPIGYPASSFGPTKRLPVREVSFGERWDNPLGS